MNHDSDLCWDDNFRVNNDYYIMMDNEAFDKNKDAHMDHNQLEPDTFDRRLVLLNKDDSKLETKQAGHRHHYCLCYC